jgi:hypothetical protein
MSVREQIEARRSARRKAARRARGLLRTRGWSLAAKLEHYSIPEPNSGCLLWTGQLDDDGYGSLWWDGRMQGAHRLALEEKIGPLPDGVQALHKCDLRCCIADAHLFPGTQAENNADMVAKGRDRWRATR